MDRVTLALLAIIFLGSGIGTASAQDRGFPSSIDPAKRYVFYMHGTKVEKHGASHDNKYYDIIEALEAEGLVAIGEVRSSVNIMDYAKRVAGQVKKLIQAGVPADHITVAGHSRGAKMTHRAAAVLKNPKVRFASLAGCGVQPGHTSTQNYKRLLKKLAHKMRGTFLNMWAEDDDIVGSCDGAMNKAGISTYRNVVIPSGGHEVFFKPNAVWFTPFVAFAKGS